MQGVLIISSDPAVRASLRAILGDGKTVHERETAGEALRLAAAQQLDLIFVDDIFPDGTAEEVVDGLLRLGYSANVVPLLLSAEPQYLAPFQARGIRHFLVKPFEVGRVRELVELTESGVIAFEADSAGVRAPGMPAGAPGPPAPGLSDTTRFRPLPSEVREIFIRLHRLLTRTLDSRELLGAFAEVLAEQLDSDNVVLLIPEEGAPRFRVFSGDVVEEVREQFFIPFASPLLAAVLRLGEPVSLYDDSRLDSSLRETARRYGERLGVQVLCPVISRSRLLALVGISRSHRYTAPAALGELLRLFLTFLAKAMEHAVRYEHCAGREQRLRALVEALPTGAVVVDGEGKIAELNPLASRLLGVPGEDYCGRPIEKLDSRLAGIAREMLEGGAAPGEHEVVLPGNRSHRGVLRVSTARAALADSSSRSPADGGVVLFFRFAGDSAASGAAGGDAGGGQESDGNLWIRAAESLAHNFKNALVPLKTCAELLPERHNDAEFRESFFKISEENIHRIDQWISQLMRMGQAAEGPGRMTAYALQEALDEGLAKALEEFPDFDPQNVVKEYASRARSVGDKAKMTLVFYEILRNALAALRGVQNPRLRLRTQVFAGVVQASLIDNGPGFEESARAQAFRPFSGGRLDGLGLGLAYAQTVVQAHGGKISILPAFETGTCVQVVLPIDPAILEKS